MYEYIPTAWERAMMVYTNAVIDLKHEMNKARRWQLQKRANYALKVAASVDNPFPGWKLPRVPYSIEEIEMELEETLESILAREWGQSLQPYEYYVPHHFQRLIDAGWAWQRMSVKGRWILGWTEAGWAAARDCGLEPDGEETEDAAYQLGALVRVKEFNQRGLVTKITVEADGKRIYVVTCENFEAYALPHGDIEPA